MIDKKEVLLYLGTKGKSDEFTDKMIDGAIMETNKFIEPKTFYKIFDIKQSGGKIVLLNTAVEFTGNSINLRLAGCNKCIVFYATLGYEIDKKIKQLQSANLSKAVIINACASAALENVCEELCSALQKEFSQNSLTKRFSPGYGDLPIEFNKDILNILNAQRQAGIIFNQGGLMTPSKTVTAIIGVK